MVKTVGSKTLGKHKISEKSLANLRPIKPGEVRNPNGAAAHAKSRLNNKFVKALEKDFDEHGTDAIVLCRENDPGRYVGILASLLPKEATLNIQNQSALDDLSLEQLTTLLAGLEQLQAICFSDKSEDMAEADKGELPQLH